MRSSTRTVCRTPKSNARTTTACRGTLRSPRSRSVVGVRSFARPPAVRRRPLAAHPDVLTGRGLRQGAGSTSWPTQTDRTLITQIPTRRLPASTDRHTQARRRGAHPGGSERRVARVPPCRDGMADQQSAHLGLAGCRVGYLRLHPAVRPLDHSAATCLHACLLAY